MKNAGEAVIVVDVSQSWRFRAVSEEKVVHRFREYERKYYNIGGTWGDIAEAYTSDSDAVVPND